MPIWTAYLCAQGKIPLERGSPLLVVGGVYLYLYLQVCGMVLRFYSFFALHVDLLGIEEFTQGLGIRLIGWYLPLLLLNIF